MSNVSRKEQRIAQSVAHAAKCREKADREQRDADEWRRMDRGRGLYVDEIRTCEACRDGWLRTAREWDAQAIKDGLVTC